MIKRKYGLAALLLYIDTYATIGYLSVCLSKSGSLSSCTKLQLTAYSSLSNMNPFGVPITEETLKAMSRYVGRDITQVDCAREAVRLIHAEDKNLNALQHALDLKSSYGDGVSTMVLVYNATGSTVELVHGQNKDWSGYVNHEQPPTNFQNGQWLAFLHVHPQAQAIGCEAARVFRSRNVSGDVRDFMVAWSLPWGNTPNSVSSPTHCKFS